MLWPCWKQPEEKLAAGQVGTVVEVHAPGLFEVEFLDAEGRTVALAEFKREQLLALKHEPAAATVYEKPAKYRK